MPKIFVEAWDPEYGSSFAPGEMAPALAEVDPPVEIPAESWKPIPPEPAAGAAERLAFIDGVRRIDALVWIEDSDGCFAGDMRVNDFSPPPERANLAR